MQLLNVNSTHESFAYVCKQSCNLIFVTSLQYINSVTGNEGHDDQ